MNRIMDYYLKERRKEQTVVPPHMLLWWDVDLPGYKSGYIYLRCIRPAVDEKKENVKGQTCLKLPTSFAKDPTKERI